MDDNFHSTINNPSDGFVPKTVAQDSGECPELSILFKVKRHEGGPLPHSYLPLKPLAPYVMKQKL